MKMTSIRDDIFAPPKDPYVAPDDEIDSDSDLEDVDYDGEGDLKYNPLLKIK